MHSSWNRCARPLGQWLHGAAREQYGHLPNYVGCVARHAEFHQEAGKVADIINAQRYEEAARMLAYHSSYAAASAAVALSLSKLRRDCEARGVS